jgi:hypothetical protein
MKASGATMTQMRARSLPLRGNSTASTHERAAKPKSTALIRSPAGTRAER